MHNGGGWGNLGVKCGIWGLSGRISGVNGWSSCGFFCRLYFCLSRRFFFSLTEFTECTELTLRVPSGFDLSPTDYTDDSDSFLFLIRSFLALPKTLLPSVVIFATLGIVQASLTLLSLTAKIPYSLLPAPYSLLLAPCSILPTP